MLVTRDDGGMKSPIFYVIVPTRGRREGVTRLVDALRQQRCLPTMVLIVGASADDVPVAFDPEIAGMDVRYIVSDQPSAARQRNLALEVLDRDGLLGNPAALVAFFDDDFRPDTFWLANAGVPFADAGVVAITGALLADGAVSGEVSETKATQMLMARYDDDLAAHTITYDVDLYGCNMVVRGTALKVSRFDEALPLYSWLEDLDLQGQVSRHGRTAHVPACRGVHLGMRGGRTSGVRFGYSQIANPVYLASKGSISRKKMLRFVIRAFLSNILRSMQPGTSIDYFGRLRGGSKAFGDAIRGCLHPSRILDFN